jgi:DHA1 family bicyclomycin/chloramphenicol resistance-like MFS transporter
MLLVLGLLTAFAPLTIDMYLPALPVIGEQLSASASSVQLTLASFMAGMGVGQLVYGPASDRLGRLGPLLAGVALYTMASLGCAFADSVEGLIALRFAQALGAASGPVIARAVVRDRYAGTEVARVLSFLMLVMGAAPILAPLLGGVLLEGYGWRAIFLVLAAIGALAFGLACLAVPRRPSAPAAPLGVNVRALMADRQFLFACLAGGFSQAAMFAYISGAPFVFMQRHGFAPREFALLFGVNAAGLIVCSQYNRALLRSVQPARICFFATCAFVLASVAVGAVAWLPAAPALALAAPLFVCISVVGLIIPNATAIAFEHHAPRAGVASSLLGASQFTLAALSSTLTGLCNDGTARPMATVIGVCALAALGLQLSPSLRQLRTT